MKLRPQLRNIAAAVACAALGLASAHAAAPKPNFSVRIIGFNDYHGTLQSPGTFGINTSIPTAQRPLVGGAEYMAAYVARLKAQNPNNVVVGAGDFIGASPLVSALFFDEPAIETLNKMGVEFNSVGNHEFDKGSVELKRLQNGGCKIENGVQNPNSCKGLGSAVAGTFDGAKFKWLSANVTETATGKTLFPAYGIKTFNGVKVAFIGMTLKATPTIVTPTGVAGLEFADEADTVNALVPRLRALGVESIVVLVHQGGFQGNGLSDINGCDGDLVGSDIAGIVSRLDDAVDLVISGHTHAAYNCSANTVDVKGTTGNVTVTPRPTGLPNVMGRLVPVTSASAFGRVLTSVDVTINPNTRDIVAVAPTNVLVDQTDPAINTAINASPAVRNVVNGYAALVAPQANKVIGAITGDLSNSASFDRSCNMPAGDLIADSQLAATAQPGFGDAVIAFMNRGGVRNPGFVYGQISGSEQPGEVTYGEAFTVQPFGNSLVTVTLNATQIKAALEQQFAGCLGQAATATRILIPSKGFKYDWDGAKVCGSRISNVTLTRNGSTETLVDATGNVISGSDYRVTINNFLSTGGDGFTTFLGGTNLLGGAQDIDALIAYMAAFKAPNAPYADNTAAEDLGSRRMNRVAAGNGNVCPAAVSTGNANP